MEAIIILSQILKSSFFFRRDLLATTEDSIRATSNEANVNTMLKFLQFICSFDGSQTGDLIYSSETTRFFSFRDSSGSKKRFATSEGSLKKVSIALLEFSKKIGLRLLCFADFVALRRRVCCLNSTLHLLSLNPPL